MTVALPAKVWHRIAPHALVCSLNVVTPKNGGPEEGRGEGREDGKSARVATGFDVLVYCRPRVRTLTNRAYVYVDKH